MLMDILQFTHYLWIIYSTAEVVGGIFKSEYSEYNRGRVSNDNT